MADLKFLTTAAGTRVVAAPLFVLRFIGQRYGEALAKRGFPEVAEAVLGIQKQRVSGDYLHTSAILDTDFSVIAAVNDLNDYTGPGTGYRLDGERWKQLADIRQAISPEDI